MYAAPGPRASARRARGGVEVAPPACILQWTRRARRRHSLAHEEPPAGPPAEAAGRVGARSPVREKAVQLSRDELLRAYRQMRTIRDFEETVHEEFSAGGIPGFVHLYAGEEA